MTWLEGASQWKPEPFGDRGIVQVTKPRLNTETLNLCSELRTIAAVLEETEEGCVAYEAALNARKAVESFIAWYESA